MIHELKLQNFKCFNDHKVKLRNFTILAGANASGKSSIMQALLLYFYAHQNNNIEIIDTNACLHIDIGSPKELISQNLCGDEPYLKIKTVADFGNEEIHLEVLDPGLALTIRFREMICDKSIFMQYLNAERIGPRLINQVAISQNGVSVNGENAAYMMEYADRNNFKINGKLVDDEDKSMKFSYQVEKWMSVILGDLQINVETDYSKSMTEVKYKNEVTDYAVVPPLTGFGISYILPIVVAGLYCSIQKKPSILLVENPEAHLHPYAQSNIGKFLAILSECGVQVVLETHSDHVIDGARLQMMHDKHTDEMIINYFENINHHALINEIQVLDNGDLSSWPKGFFDQKQKDLRELMKERRKV